jgi:hypothetical protein
VRLTIELLPETSWGKNLRDVLSPYKWQKLSKQIQENADYKCEICLRKKGEGITRLNCHEVWDYNQETKLQKLIQLHSLCFECHCVKHMGYSRSQDWIDTNSITQHFLKVNGVTIEEFKKHDHEAALAWRERNEIEWKIDFGEFGYLLEDEHQRKEQKKKEEYEQVFNVLKGNPRVTNKQIEEFTKLNQTAVKRYATEARKELKRQRQSIIYS